MWCDCDVQTIEIYPSHSGTEEVTDTHPTLVKHGLNKQNHIYTLHQSFFWVYVIVFYLFRESQNSNYVAI
jgi:hypothetical protein